MKGITWYASEAAALLSVFQLPMGHMALSDFDCGFSAENGSRLSGGVHAGIWLLETDWREGRIGGGEVIYPSPKHTHTHSLSPPDTCEANRHLAFTSKLRLSEPRSHLRVYFGSPFLVLLERWNISLKRGVGENNQRAS